MYTGTSESDPKSFNSTAEILAHIDQCFIKEQQQLAADPSSSQFEWSCVLETGVCNDKWDAEHQEWTDAAYNADWDTLLRIAVGPNWHFQMGRYANSIGLRAAKGGPTPARNPPGYTALHLAAWHGASIDIVDGLLKLGASRGFRTADSKKQRPLDIARDRGHAHLYGILTPVGLPDVSDEDLCKVEAHFHKVIMESARVFDPQSMRLPDLGLLRDLPRIWMPIPGMYGGFKFWWDDGHLVTESFCRVVGGSGRTNHITARGAKLVDQGWD